MRPSRCELQPVSLKQWLTCGLCWEVKLGVTFLLLSVALLLWEAPSLPAWRAPLGWLCYWSGVACLLYGLGRDVIIIGKALWARARRRRKSK